MTLKANTVTKGINILEKKTPFVTELKQLNTNGTHSFSTIFGKRQISDNSTLPPKV